MFRRVVALSTVVLVIAACSSSPAESSPGDGGTGSSAGAEPSTASTGGGGGGDTDACALITADEASSVMGISLEAELTAGITSYCIYSGAAADTFALVATTFNTSNANDILGAYDGQDGVTDVSGIGDRAIWVEASATLFVAKGDAVIGISAGDGTMDLAQRQDYAEQLGAIAAGRM